MCLDSVFLARDPARNALDAAFAYQQTMRLLGVIDRLMTGTIGDVKAFVGHRRISATKKVSKGQAHPTRKNSDVDGHVQGRQVATNIQAHQTHGDTGALQQHVTPRTFGRVAALSGCSERCSCTSTEKSGQGLLGCDARVARTNCREVWPKKSKA